MLPGRMEMVVETAAAVGCWCTGCLWGVNREGGAYFFFFLVLVSVGTCETQFCVSEDEEEDKKIFFIMIVI